MSEARAVGREAGVGVWIGIDIGTEGVRVGAHAFDGRRVATAAAPRPARMPEPGAMVHDPEADWWGGVVEAVRALVADLGSVPVAGVGLAALFPAACLTDADGRPLTEGFLYGDTRAGGDVPAVADLTGRPLTGDEVAPRLRWLARTHPDPLERAAAIDGPAGYVVRRLTGATAIDPHSAVRWGGLAGDGRGWDEEAAARLGLDASWLPPIADPTAVVGNVGADAAAATGLPAGTPIVMGATDSFCQLLGDGVSRPGAGLAYYGSSGTLMIATDDFAAALADRSRFGEGRPYRLVAYVRSLGRFLETVRGPLLGDRSLEALDALADAVAPGADGLLAYPRVAGRRDVAGGPAGASGFVGLALQHGPGHLWRAALESFGFVLMEAGERLATPLDDVVAAGGGARSATWRSIVSDQTGWRQRAASGGGAARGAAFLAALGTGALPAGSRLEDAWPADEAADDTPTTPDAARHRRYRELMPVWRRVDGLLAGAAS